MLTFDGKLPIATDSVERTLTIPSMDTVSNSLDLAGYEGGIIQCPSSLSGRWWEWQTSNDNSNWHNALNDWGRELPVMQWQHREVDDPETLSVHAVATAESNLILIPWEVFDARYMRIVTEASQGSERTFTVRLNAY